MKSLAFYDNQDYLRCFDPWDMKKTEEASVFFTGLS